MRTIDLTKTDVKPTVDNPRTGVMWQGNRDRDGHVRYIWLEYAKDASKLYLERGSPLSSRKPALSSGYDKYERQFCLSYGIWSWIRNLI